MNISLAVMHEAMQYVKVFDVAKQTDSLFGMLQTQTNGVIQTMKHHSNVLNIRTVG